MLGRDLMTPAEYRISQGMPAVSSYKAELANA
jgi:hypothetical protein